MVMYSYEVVNLLLFLSHSTFQKVKIAFCINSILQQLLACHLENILYGWIKGAKFQSLEWSALFTFSITTIICFFVRLDFSPYPTPDETFTVCTSISLALPFQVYFCTTLFIIAPVHMYSCVIKLGITTYTYGTHLTLCIFQRIHHLNYDISSIATQNTIIYTT